MLKRRLGCSNLEVSAMGLGCWAIGGSWDWQEADGSKEPDGWGQVNDAMSIRAIQTDYIDLYQFHKGDYDPGKAAEVCDVLERLVEEGKIRWYGWSTINPEGARVFAQDQHCTAIQHWLNMGTDMPEILAVCERNDQASIIRSPLGSGNLTGKFNRETIFPKDDMRSA